MRTGVQTKAKAAAKPSFMPVWGGLLQRKCACGGAAGLTGACAACRGKALAARPPLIQAKLTVGQPEDRYVRKADRVADRMMRMPEPDQDEEVEDIQIALARISTYVTEPMTGNAYLRRRA